MLLYFRKVNEGDLERKEIWYQKALSECNSYQYDNSYCKGILEQKELQKKARLYYIEKGDDTYGVFSYSIGQLILIELAAKVGEVLIIPNNDAEFDESVREELFRMILAGSFNNLGYDNILISTRILSAEETNAFIDAGCTYYEKNTGSREYISTKKIKKVFVAGVNSELGYEVVQELNRRNIIALGCDKDGTGDKTNTDFCDLDISDQDNTRRVLMSFMPDAVINCYSWSNVDEAELYENQKNVYEANVVGARNLAVICKEISAKMMQMTSDYVFDGSGTDAWDSECKDYSPLNYYGKTKAEAEQIVSSMLSKYFIIRTEWTYGYKSRNFVDLVLDFAKKRNEITIVDDQFGTPTYYKDIARLLVDIIETEKYGFYNVTNSGGYISRYEYANAIIRIASELGNKEYDLNKIKVEPVSSDEYKLSRAIRPHNSRLNIEKLEKAGFTPLPNWEDALKRYIAGIMKCN